MRAGVSVLQGLPVGLEKQQDACWGRPRGVGNRENFQDKVDLRRGRQESHPAFMGAASGLGWARRAGAGGGWGRRLGAGCAQCRSLSQTECPVGERRVRGGRPRGCLALQGIFPPRGRTRTSCLLHRQAGSLPLGPPGKPHYCSARFRGYSGYIHELSIKWPRQAATALSCSLAVNDLPGHHGWKQKFTHPGPSDKGFKMCPVAQSRPTLGGRVDCSPPGSFAHGRFQARIPEWVAISSSRGSPLLGDWTHVSCVPCIGGWILYR